MHTYTHKYTCTKIHTYTQLTLWLCQKHNSQWYFYGLVSNSNVYFILQFHTECFWKQFQIPDSKVESSFQRVLVQAIIILVI